MGIRDEASLSARERATLAHLEARAAAADPHLASRLHGEPRHFRLTIPALPVWRGPAWLCLPLIVTGLALGVIGVGTALAVAVMGILIVAVGLWMLAGAVEQRYLRRTPAE